MLKTKIYVVAGLLLCSASAFAQSSKQTPDAYHNQEASLDAPALPGEENLSAQERAERDFLMPTRRKKAAAAAAKVEEMQQAAIDATAHNLEMAEAVAATAAADTPLARPAAARTTTHRRPASHATTTRRKTTSRPTHSSAKKKSAPAHKATTTTRKKTTTHRR